MDLQAADGAGAHGIGVTTGIYTREELAAASPGMILFLRRLVWPADSPALFAAVLSFNIPTAHAPCSAELQRSVPAESVILPGLEELSAVLAAFSLQQ